MRYEIERTAPALRELWKLDKPLARRILKAVTKLSLDPARWRPSRSAPTHGRGGAVPLHPEQRALPISELADADAVHGYSFIVTNLDVSTPDKAAGVEHWYRHRTQAENISRDAKHGAALRHLPSVIWSPSACVLDVHGAA